MKKLDPKTEIIIGLQEQGYYYDFIVQHEFLKCIQDGALISPDDFEIAGTYILQTTDISKCPHLIYAINSMHNGMKGIMMLPYSKFIKGMSIHLWAKFATQLKYAAQVISYQNKAVRPRTLPSLNKSQKDNLIFFANLPLEHPELQHFNFSRN